MGEKDREIWIGENKVYLGEDNFIYMNASKGVDRKAAIFIKDAILKLANKVEGKVSYLVDLNNAGKPSVEARRIFKELVENEKIAKVAYYGVHPISRVIAAFAIGFTQKKDVQFFKTKEEALSWLRGFVEKKEL
jgi:hypothetical protein